MPRYASHSNVRVYVRIRPFNDKELQEARNPKSILQATPTAVRVLEPKNDFACKVEYAFDRCFDSQGLTIHQPGKSGGASSSSANNVPSSPPPPSLLDTSNVADLLKSIPVGLGTQLMAAGKLAGGGVGRAGQADVYSVVGTQCLDNAFEGYNGCLFAYGQTGSGKTHTMMGEIEGPERGIVPRLCEDLFTRIEKARLCGDNMSSFKVEASYMEIYMERANDLLNPSGIDLNVRQHPVTGPYVEHLSVHRVTDVASVLALMRTGAERRATACTKLNDHSSRSHAIFMLRFVQTNFRASSEGAQGEVVQTRSKTSHINLVDLAGSERIKMSGVTGCHLEEAKKINLSLTTLGRVIDLLADRKLPPAGGSTSGGQQPRPSVLPVRESMLTWLLAESLGGNSKTIMVATVSPHASAFDETLNTLRYASRAKCIVNETTVNEVTDTRMIDELKDELADLRQLLKEQALGRELEVTSLADKLKTREKTIADLKNLMMNTEAEWLARETAVAQQHAAEQQQISAVIDELQNRVVSLESNERTNAEAHARLRAKYEATEKKLQQSTEQHRRHLTSLETQAEDRFSRLKETLQTAKATELAAAEDRHRTAVRQMHSQYQTLLNAIAAHTSGIVTAAVNTSESKLEVLNTLSSRAMVMTANRMVEDKVAELNRNHNAALLEMKHKHHERMASLEATMRQKMNDALNSERANLNRREQALQAEVAALRTQQRTLQVRLQEQESKYITDMGAMGEVVRRLRQLIQEQEHHSTHSIEAPLRTLLNAVVRNQTNVRLEHQRALQALPSHLDWVIAEIHQQPDGLSSLARIGAPPPPRLTPTPPTTNSTPPPIPIIGSQLAASTSTNAQNTTAVIPTEETGDSFESQMLPRSPRAQGNMVAASFLVEAGATMVTENASSFCSSPNMMSAYSGGGLGCRSDGATPVAEEEVVPNIPTEDLAVLAMSNRNSGSTAIRREQLCPKHEAEVRQHQQQMARDRAFITACDDAEEQFYNCHNHSHSFGPHRSPSNRIPACSSATFGTGSFGPASPPVTTIPTYPTAFLVRRGSAPTIATSVVIPVSSPSSSSFSFSSFPPSPSLHLDQVMPTASSTAPTGSGLEKCDEGVKKTDSSMKGLEWEPLNLSIAMSGGGDDGSNEDTGAEVSATCRTGEEMENPTTDDFQGLSRNFAVSSHTPKLAIHSSSPLFHPPPPPPPPPLAAQINAIESQVQDPPSEAVEKTSESVRIPELLQTASRPMGCISPPLPTTVRDPMAYMDVASPPPPPSAPPAATAPHQRGVGGRPRVADPSPKRPPVQQQMAATVPPPRASVVTAAANAGSPAMGTLASTSSSSSSSTLIHSGRAMTPTGNVGVRARSNNMGHRASSPAVSSIHRTSSNPNATPSPAGPRGMAPASSSVGGTGASTAGTTPTVRRRCGSMTMGNNTSNSQQEGVDGVGPVPALTGQASSTNAKVAAASVYPSPSLMKLLAKATGDQDVIDDVTSGVNDSDQASSGIQSEAV